ncbi:Sau3AI family type II restriction endonuclease [Sporosarcina pasteurii]|uniref:Type-2 restriction enzyme Sau3AI n=1 Tax=Sporosarcina pasteurii TaxID=1474 RepID=A0A380CJJ2_SPOPA|nr:Sau3AI family type II restriction endonuclease [Sporosarcina pasteurii]MDS9471939.1 Sau3AI family type II restriction endonuclease [Sporosarcina pasteurii]QBQ06670.1 restriction endonuclease [Sporosarcina pasteurii]SUJ21924.1 Type-2 restriction enzyme Sau3AI [Sporosarcina pasteurii]
MLYKTEEELIYKARRAEGKSFGDIDKSGRIQNERAKGHLGQIVEESHFGYEVNSNREADFENLGVELKVTPVRRNKNGTLSAKERLVLNIINFHEEVQRDFHTSSFWLKNEKILMMFYKWFPEVKRADYRILKAYLHKYPEEDLEVIKKDWELIVQKIKDGRAHELSEADTNYLGACSKGANKSSLRSQPFSDEMAMQRAFSLKQSYMTALVRKVIRQEDLVRFSTASELKKKSLEQLLWDKFSPYIGKSLEEISEVTQQVINPNPKHFLQQFVSGLLGIRGIRLNQIEEFAKANIHLKTIRLEPNGIPKEHMSFKNIDFIEWANESWDDSWLKNYFEETKLLFVVFEYKETEGENPDGKLYFKGIKLWNMPKKKIDNQLKDFWVHTQSLIQDGIELTPVKQKTRTIVRNNLPKPGYNGVCHIRPKARDGSDKTELPDGRMITKQAFWLDNKYIAEIIESINPEKNIKG